MTLYLLKGGEQVSLPTRPLVIRVQSPTGAVSHRLRAAVPPGAPAPVALERYGMLVLPRLSGPTTAQLIPAPGLDLFPPQSVLNVLVGPDGGDPNADYAQLTVDVSGLPVADLVTFVPAGPSIQVQALGRPKDPDLPPHAELARDVTRELLGRPTVSRDDAVDLVIGVDCSPSMRSYTGDGSLEATLEVFAGVASVLDPDAEVEGVLVGRQSMRLRPEAIDTFARSTTEAVGRQPLITGLRSATLGSPAAGALTYLVTDAVPADFVAGPDRPHLVILGARGEVGPGLSGTAVPIAATTSVPRWDRHQMRVVVASLLGPYTRRGGPR